MKVLNKVSDAVFRFEKWLAVLLALLLLVALAGGVLYRYLLKLPLFWADELAIFCLIWMTFVGGSMSLKVKEAPTINLLTDTVSPKMKRVFLILSNVILLVFTAYILYLSYYWLSASNIKVQTSTAMNMPKIYSYLSIPVSFICTAIHLLNSTVMALLGREEKGGLQ
ncbi:TRAP transporter small permease [Lysinibacillus yapensis]|uniref:TRAP transporter small permease n=1 Tax=Ureibacillus yapensis TaxID=2304605 RepID=A0A396SGB7_9BACL|nr:TRAP transporter small permease subunit [Lysinibacillus yapensis]RHW40092.1 TRAP transporter small permease [Lysinibacillus yapensis]